MRHAAQCFSFRLFVGLCFSGCFQPVKHFFRVFGRALFLFLTDSRQFSTGFQYFPDDRNSEIIRISGTWTTNRNTLVQLLVMQAVAELSQGQIARTSSISHNQDKQSCDDVLRLTCPSHGKLIVSQLLKGVSLRVTTENMHVRHVRKSPLLHSTCQTGSVPSKKFLIIHVLRHCLLIEAVPEETCKWVGCRTRFKTQHHNYSAESKSLIDGRCRSADRCHGSLGREG